MLLSASFLACRHLLDENPKDQVFVDNFFQTENDATAAVNSVYAILNATSSAPTFGGVYFSTYWVTMGLCSDEMDNRLPAVDLNELNSFTHKPVNASLYDFWVLAYKGINNAN
ncbi:MAG: RagB/SusD family nutrient uptake outer membrane protein, partial [Bacteroidota bacterium]